MSLSRSTLALLLAGAAAIALPAMSSATATAAAAPDISLSNMQTHLQQFQTIAENNGGNRRSTSAGYTASVTYVYDKLVAAGFNVVKQNCTSGCTSGSGPNVIADWPGGDTNNTIMFGSHLDSVSAGPGSNDNGSGSSMVLELALTLAAQNPTMTKHVRFGWWTDEEQGLNGSEFYANNLSSADRSKINAYYNFDMVASTNGGYFINRITSTPGRTMKEYFDSIGVQTEENTEGAGRSDDASFNAAGIQTSGFATGASAVKTAAQVTKWGGSQSSYDPCYHRACDTYPSNVNTTRLDRAGDAAAYVLWKEAVATANDFSLAASPASGSVNPGSSLTTTVTATQLTGTGQTVNLSASGLPAGATASFSPTAISSSGGSSTLTIATTSSTPAGTYSVTITGAGSTVTRTTTFSLTVNGAPGCSGTNANDVAIGDNTTVSSSIVISGCTGNASATSTVEVHIVHTYIGDLKVDLIAPDGTVYVLHNRTGSGTDNINQTYTVNVSSEVANGTWKLQVNDNAGGDVGKIDTWTLNLGGGTTPPGCTGSNANDVAIADNTTVTSNIVISGCTGNASATSTVEVHIVHTYIGDLKVDLIAPDGTVYVLHNRTGSGTDNINQTYTVNLSSEVRNGTWKLQVNDNAANDIGKIDTWTLTL